MSYWKFGKKYAGITARGKRFVVDSLKAAMNKSGSKSRVSKTSKKRRKTSKRRSNPMPRRKKTRRSRAKGFLSGLGKNLSLKGVATGSAGLVVMKRVQPFGGAYKPAIDKMILGTVLPMIKMGNRDMFTVGVKEAIATAVDGYLGGNMQITGNQSGGML